MEAVADKKWAGDEALFVRFYVDAVEAPLRSKELGYKVFEDREFIEIRWDNDDSVFVSEVRDFDPGTGYEGDRVRFARQYEMFKAGHHDQVIGIPIRNLFPSEPSKVKTYEALSVVTVEQLAAMSDSSMQSVGMGSFEDRKKAKAYLEAAKRQFADEQFTKQLTERDEKIKELEEKVAKMTDYIQKQRETKESTKHDTVRTKS